MLHRRDEQCTDLLCSISAVQASVWSICTANTQVVGRASLDHFSDCIFLLCICFQDGSGGSFTKGSELLWKKVESECESALRMNSVGRFGVSAPAAAMLSPSSWATSVLLLSFLSNSAEVSRNSEKHRKIRREIISSFVNCNSGEKSWAAAAESFSEGPQVKLRPPSQFKLDCYQHPLVLWGGFMRIRQECGTYRTGITFPCQHINFCQLLQDQTAVAHLQRSQTRSFIYFHPSLYWAVLWSLISYHPDLFWGDGAHLAHAAAAVHPHAGLCGYRVLGLGVLGVDAGKRQTESAGSVWSSTFP